MNTASVANNVVDGSIIGYEPHPHGAYVTINTCNGPLIIAFDLENLNHVAHARDAVVKFGDVLAGIPQIDRFRFTQYGVAFAGETVSNWRDEQANAYVDA